MLAAHVDLDLGRRARRDRRGRRPSRSPISSEGEKVPRGHRRRRLAAGEHRVAVPRDRTRALVDLEADELFGAMPSRRFCWRSAAARRELTIELDGAPAEAGLERSVVRRCRCRRAQLPRGAGCRGRRGRGAGRRRPRGRPRARAAGGFDEQLEAVLAGVAGAAESTGALPTRCRDLENAASVAATAA